MEIYKKPVFKISEVPRTINGVTLSEQDIERLSFGESSGLLQNLMFDDGVLRDGKVWLSRDESNQLEINYLFSKPEILIPKQIEDYIIPESDRMRLLNNQTAGPFLFGGQHVFLQVDHHINRIVVKSGHEVNVPKKIAGYSLTAADMNALANGEKMKNHLFCIEGKYYTAEIGMTADKRGLFFDCYKDQNHLSAEQLKTLEKSLNTPAAPAPPLELSPTLETVNALKKKDFAKYSLSPVREKNPPEGGNTRRQEIFRDAVDNYNINMLVHLKESGFAPDVSDIEYIRNNINLDDGEKKIVATVLEINHQEVTYDDYNRPDHVSVIRQEVQQQDRNSEKDAEQPKGTPSGQPNKIENTEKKHFQNPGASVELEKEKKDSKKSTDPAFAQKVGNMITEAFNNM